MSLKIFSSYSANQFKISYLPDKDQDHQSTLDDGQDLQPESTDDHGSPKLY